MSRPWPKPVMAVPAPRSSLPIENGAAWAGAFPHVADHLVVRSSRLHEHMLHDHMLHEHGRPGREINGLPLADLHHFEHVEQAMGLNDLSHQHQEDVGTHTRVSAEPEAAPITRVLGDTDGGYLPPSRAWSVPA
jgi:hypothetical protein